MVSLKFSSLVFSSIKLIKNNLTFSSSIKLSLIPVSILLSCNFSQVLAQSTSLIRNKLPVQLQHAEGSYVLIVPDKNTTQSAFGGKLRIYDAHIAKMFEVTYADCQEMDAGYRDWYYYADNGKINMGHFSISCELANQIGRSYGLGKSDTTVIAYSQEEAGSPITRTRSIPTLNLTAQNENTWLSFVQSFQPIKY